MRADAPAGRGSAAKCRRQCATRLNHRGCSRCPRRSPHPMSSNPRRRRRPLPSSLGPTRRLSLSFAAVPPPPPQDHHHPAGALRAAVGGGLSAHLLTMTWLPGWPPAGEIGRRPSRLPCRPYYWHPWRRWLGKQRMQLGFKRCQARSRRNSIAAHTAPFRCSAASAAYLAPTIRSSTGSAVAFHTVRKLHGGVDGAVLVFRTRRGMQRVSPRGRCSPIGPIISRCCGG